MQHLPRTGTGAPRPQARWASDWPGEPPQVLSVSSANALFRGLLESTHPGLWIAGEVNGWKRYPSGHCYFALRDASAQLRCVMFRTEAQNLPTDPEEGMEIRIFGAPTLYERRGEFQIVVRQLEGLGTGGLWKLAFDRLRARLDAEGLLAAGRKRPLPPYPVGVGIVTSPVGAALQDILTVIKRRAPWIPVFLSLTRVQGQGAAEQIARAIRRFDGCAGVDVIIVGRGGGAVDDLWAFNEEVVARAIASAPYPVISAVGHEVDYTIADLVADVRAPTPSAAAELAVPDRELVLRQCETLGRRLRSGSRMALARVEGDMLGLGRRLESGVRVGLRARLERSERIATMLEALSPIAAMRRGYSVAQGPGGRVLRSIADFERGSLVVLRVADGRVRCIVEGVTGPEDG